MRAETGSLNNFSGSAEKIPSVSVIVAVYNGKGYLKSSLPAIADDADELTEVILVDDGSTDNSAEVGENYGAKVISLTKCQGSANARNVGVRTASGDIILFVDADVVIRSGTINHLRRIFSENPTISAVFGSYDYDPAEPSFFSQYRNLMHHYYHQSGNPEAETFWSGFGAVKRRVFLEVGGFDAQKFQIPSIEDIEFGYRLRGENYRILLVPSMQAKHLKKWTFISILRTDIWQRAIPWAEIILLNPQVKHELNAKTSQKISGALSASMLLFIGLSIWSWRFGMLSFIVLVIILFINLDFYKFFYNRKGLPFTLLVLPMHLLYFLYSSAAFLYSWINVKLLNRTVVVR